MKFAWIDDMTDRDLWWFSVALACEVLEVSTSGFYDWQARRDGPPTARQRETAALVAPSGASMPTTTATGRPGSTAN